MIKIEHNGDEWHGTFGIALTAMVDDLLSDGVPIAATVTYNAEGIVITDDVTIAERKGESLYTIEDSGDPGAIELDTILALAVP